MVYPERGICKLTTDIQRQTQLFVTGLTAAAVLLLVALLIAGYDLEGAIWTVLALAAVNAVAERSGIWVTRTTQMSIALLPTLFAAVLFGPLAAGIVNAASMLGDPELLGPF